MFNEAKARKFARVMALLTANAFCIGDGLACVGTWLMVMLSVSPVSGLWGVARLVPGESSFTVTGCSHQQVDHRQGDGDGNRAVLIRTCSIAQRMAKSIFVTSPVWPVWA